MKALVKSKAEPDSGSKIFPSRRSASTTCWCGALYRHLRTDVHIYDWDEWRKARFPCPCIGHEFVGEVVLVGSNVTTFSPATLSAEGHVSAGDAATALPTPSPVRIHSRCGRQSAELLPSTSHCP